MDSQYHTLSEKVSTLEKQVNEIKTTLNKHDANDIRLEEKLQGLEHQVESIKHDVITTLNEHSQQTWQLIHQGIRVICILVGVICAMAGVKLLPEIFKLLGGV